MLYLLVQSVAKTSAIHISCRYCRAVEKKLPLAYRNLLATIAPLGLIPPIFNTLLWFKKQLLSLSS